MNTIPLTFNERQVNRAVLGGKEKVPDVKIDAGVILINQKGSQFRIPVIEALVKTGFSQIVSIETNPENYNIEDYSKRFPFVKFVVPLEKTTEGELVNLGMSELSTDYVFVIKDTLKFQGELVTPRIVEKLIEMNCFCVAPRLVGEGITSFPIVFSPSVNRSVFEVRASSVVTDGINSLYPLDFIGFYNRKKFILLGGFDYTITSPHWQNLDLGFRSWLWGEKLKVTTIFSLCYSEDMPVENVTPDLSYSRFYMKNLLPRFDEDHGVIPKSSFLVYLLRSGCGLVESVKQFVGARHWVKRNMYRFKIDAKYLVENWGKL